MFNQGDRVYTPKGMGTVLYRRMNALDLSKVQAYSVLLDSSKTASELPPFPTANGTTFPESVVSAIML